MRKLGLTDADFDTVAVTLEETLREFKLTDAQVKQAMTTAVGGTREAVRAPPPSASLAASACAPPPQQRRPEGQRFFCL